MSLDLISILVLNQTHTTPTWPTVTTNAQFNSHELARQQFRNSRFSSVNEILFLRQHDLTSRVWCQSDHRDYCPLAISAMLLVIVLSSAFIFCLCYSRDILRSHMFSGMLEVFGVKQRSSRRTDDLYTEQQINSIYVSTVTSGGDQDDLAAVVASSAQQTNSSFNRFNNLSFISNLSTDNIWFTDLSKHNGQRPDSPLPPPPPTYEESQHMSNMISRTKSSFNRVIRTSPRKLSNKRPIFLAQTTSNRSQLNSGFLLETEATVPFDDTNVSQVQGRVSFPAYRCMTLTTERPCTSGEQTNRQITLERVGHRLLEENHDRIRQSESVSQRALTSGDFDIPPAYETVINESKPHVDNTSPSNNREFVI